MQSRIAPQPTTVTLCFLCILVTLAHTSSGPQDGSLWSRIGHFTDVTSAEIWNGRYTPLFTTMFLHEDFTHGLGVTHLLFDVIWLYQLGCYVEFAIGPVWYMLFIVASAVVSSCVEMAWSGQTGIGASGVVYALFGLMWAGRFRHVDWQVVTTPYNIRSMVGWAVFCIFTTYAGIMSIANGAHFGGLAFGYSIGMLCFGRRFRWAWIAPLVAIAALAVMSLTYVPWSVEWLWWKAGKAFDAEKYPQAVSYYRQSLRYGAPPPDTWVNIASAWHNQAIIDDSRGDDAAAARDEREEAAATAKSGRSPDKDEQ